MIDRITQILADNPPIQPSLERKRRIHPDHPMRPSSESNMLWQTLDPLFPYIFILIVLAVIVISLYKTDRMLRFAYLISAGLGSVAGALGLIFVLFLAQAFFVDRPRDIEALEFFFMYLVTPVGAILGLIIASTYALVDERYHQEAKKVLLVGGLPIVLIYLPYFVAAMFPTGPLRLPETKDVGIYVAYLLFGLLPILLIVGMWRRIPKSV